MNPYDLIWGIFYSVGLWVCDYLPQAFISTAAAAWQWSSPSCFLRRVCCLQRDLEEGEEIVLLILCKSKDNKLEWPLFIPFPRRNGVLGTQILTSLPRQQEHCLSTFPLWCHAPWVTNRQEGNHLLSWGSAEAAALGPLDVNIDERVKEDGRNWQVSLELPKPFSKKDF